MNAMALVIHATMEHVKITMDLTTASVHLVMSLIQVRKFVLVSSYNLINIVVHIDKSYNCFE